LEAVEIAGFGIRQQYQPSPLCFLETQSGEG
jgi:hypothetical protein